VACFDGGLGWCSFGEEAVPRSLAVMVATSFGHSASRKQKRCSSVRLDDRQEAAASVRFARGKGRRCSGSQRRWRSELYRTRTGRRMAGTPASNTSRWRDKTRRVGSGVMAVPFGQRMQGGQGGWTSRGVHARHGRHMENESCRVGQA
jgi:hypothetical protein